jgi:DNA-3-methyladenine glycosylase II
MDGGRLLRASGLPSVDRTILCAKHPRMWFDRPPGRPDWRAAERRLRRADAKLAAIVKRVGPCTLAPRRDYFVVLCKAIFTQQISTAVAAVLFARFRAQFPRRRPTPAHVIRLLKKPCADMQDGNGSPPAAIRACGLSRQKAAYLLDLARHFDDGKIPTRRLSGMSDEQIIDALVRVRGIGRWTAEMFLIFVLSRSDVLPVDDLGLREAVREVYGLPHRPTAAEVTAIAESWRPYRSIATWYLWRRNSSPVRRTKHRRLAKR